MGWIDVGENIREHWRFLVYVKEFGAHFGKCMRKLLRRTLRRSKEKDLGERSHSPEIEISKTK